MGDRISHTAEKAKGSVKEATGKATGNDSSEGEGRADQASADVKQASDKVGDAAKDALRS